jgi:hypothetical protein
MGWPQQLLDKLKEAASARPIHCRRGWGKVTFNLDLNYAFYLPFFGISRTCPIGGVESCSWCKHAFKAEDAERLRENLHKLDQLRKEKVLSEGEYAIRRQMIIQLRDGTEALPGEGYRTWAWIVGLPGLVITGAGFLLAPMADPVLWIAIAIGGCVMMAVSSAFAIVASTKRKEAEERRSTAG